MVVVGSDKSPLVQEGLLQEVEVDHFHRGRLDVRRCGRGHVAAVQGFLSVVVGFLRILQLRRHLAAVLLKVEEALLHIVVVHRLLVVCVKQHHMVAAEHWMEYRMAAAEH